MAQHEQVQKGVQCSASSLCCWCCVADETVVLSWAEYSTLSSQGNTDRSNIQKAIIKVNSFIAAKVNGLFNYTWQKNDNSVATAQKKVEIAKLDFGVFANILCLFCMLLFLFKYSPLLALKAEIPVYIYSN